MRKQAVNCLHDLCRAALAERDGNFTLMRYAHNLKTALIATVDNGTITGDLKGKTRNPSAEKVVDMYGFLDAVDAYLIGLADEVR